jgi:putative flippase GtrA
MVWSGSRWAEMTLTSQPMPKAVKTSAAAFITGQSESEPITMPTRVLVVTGTKSTGRLVYSCRVRPTSPGQRPPNSPSGGGAARLPAPGPGSPPPPGPAAAARRASWLAATIHLVFEGAKFGAVGALAFVVDNGLYLLLVNGPGKLLAPWPVRASILASVAAVGFSYVGNRYWTFSKKRSRAGADRRGRAPLREMLAFAAANAVGVLITGACLYLSRWILDQHSAGADVLARNIGIAVGTVFRYLAYKFWVFTASAERP